MTKIRVATNKVKSQGKDRWYNLTQCFTEALLHGTVTKLQFGPCSHASHDGFFRLLMKGIFDPYVMWPFDWKLIS